MRISRSIVSWILLVVLPYAINPAFAQELTNSQDDKAVIEKELLSQLDAPLLFVKRHSYTGIHIYDTFYKWPPGGGGIYILENPSAPRAEWKIRTVIDESSTNTLGAGVYTHPEISWDGDKILFCYKGTPTDSTSIYEININGDGLRRITDPSCTLDLYHGSNHGQHDIAPSYLPDDRIVFVTTRIGGLVPCANEGVSILHVMNADGTDMHPISVNAETEFDPSVLPDGRILFGRWEYVDKNALTIQSLWTIYPDGTKETAVYANNMVFPESVLDARPVPGSRLIAATLAKHNHTPRGSIAIIDPFVGKNDPAAIFNFEHPDDPTYDLGDSCEPYPLNDDTVIFSGRPDGHKRNAIEMMNRKGQRVTVLSDTNICLHAPMLVKKRPRPAMLPDMIDRSKTTGAFYVQDVYDGLIGIERGEAKWLRVIEETSRVSASPRSPNPYNQTFLVSGALAFATKIYHGIMPINEDGSIYFEAPSGRAIYLQVLDKDKRLIQSMRTFVQAAPGTIRSCIGCHEKKSNAPSSAMRPASKSLQGKPAQIKPESWGTGYMDYPSMIQPIWDRHCVKCHGGEDGINARLDLSGGWTSHFNISYENLADRRETQLTAYLISGIDCMNGTAHWSSQLFAPRSFGSATAPLAKVIMSGHVGRIKKMTETERDLVMAWIDSNGLYYGSWDYTDHGYFLKAWKDTVDKLTAEMAKADCSRCHDKYFANDWVNLEKPEFSRILRAPLAEGKKGYGLAICRNHKMDPKRNRIRLLRNGYAHAVKPISEFAPEPVPPIQEGGQPEPSFASTDDPLYNTMLKIIRQGRAQAMTTPRVDMPGAVIIPGKSRMLILPEVPEQAPEIRTSINSDGVACLEWERSAAIIGLTSEVHRGTSKNFTTGPETLIIETPLTSFMDTDVPPGKQYYALVLSNGNKRSKPSYAALNVPKPIPPQKPTDLTARPAPYIIYLDWKAAPEDTANYHVYRKNGKDGSSEKLTDQPLASTSYCDLGAKPGHPYTYFVCAVNKRGTESDPSETITVSSLATQDPVLSITMDNGPEAILGDGSVMKGESSGAVSGKGNILNLNKGGYITFPHMTILEPGRIIAVECWVHMESLEGIPVLLSSGLYAEHGWFLQAIGGRWRWHVGGVSCDGGQTVINKWTHLMAAKNGNEFCLYQDGKKVAGTNAPSSSGFSGRKLFAGQYSGVVDPQFQVKGRLAGIKIYHRPITENEVVTMAVTPPAD